MKFIKVIFCLIWFIPTTVLSVEYSRLPYNDYPDPSEPKLIRDPFTPSTLMFNSIGQQGMLNGGFGSIRSYSDKVPQITLRGFASTDEDKPMALLEIKQKTFLVHEGDEISVDPSNPLNVLRITKIDRLSVTVETRRLGSIRIQR